MSPGDDHHDPADSGATPSRWLRGDTVAASVLLLIAVTVLQRGVGLARNIWFCRVLADDQLGRWSLAYHFLLLAAPLVVLGLPGSFGRYTERFRQRGQLRGYLWGTTSVCLLATAAALLMMVAWPGWLARAVFGDPARTDLVRLLAGVLALVIVFNFLIELLTSLRLVRFAAAMQLTSSLVFFLLGALLLSATPWREEAVMLGYAGGMLVAALLGAGLVAWFWRSLPQAAARLPQRDLWPMLLPLAGWIWFGNLISNLFEVADQFMLKYFSGLPASAADALVGQYYASRVIPLLLISLAALLAGSLLPHLSRDWECGRRQQVERRLNSFVKFTAVLLTLGGAVFLCGSSLLFSWALGGGYTAGQSVLPGTLTYCVWYGVSCVAANYLLCAEKPRLTSLVLLVGLAINVVLNYLLAPRLGLAGVVAATVVANAVALAGIFYVTSLAEMRWQRSTWLLAALPLALLLGGPAALAILAIVLAVGWREGWLVTRGERQQLNQLATSLVGRAALPASNT